MTDDRRRPRRRWIFLLIAVMAFLGMTWPGAYLTARITPYIFGLPFAFCWLLIWLLILFLALLVQYRLDLRDDAQGGGHAR